MPGDEEVAEGTDDPEAPEVEDELADQAVSEIEGSGPGEEEEELDTGTLDQEPAPPPPAVPPGITPQDLAMAFHNAIQPLVPRPPQQKMWWDDAKQMQERMLSGHEKFHGAFHEVLDHKLSQAVGPLRDVINKQNEIISFLYARGAEREDFGTIANRADEIVQAYSVPYRVALRMASDEAGKNSGKPPAKGAGRQVRVPPRHATAPSTRRGIPAGGRGSKGSADFSDIMREVVGEEESGRR